MNTLFLLRHGRRIPDEVWRYTGRRHVDLSEEGREQARQWSRILNGAGIEAVHASPLKRCLESARIIAAGLGLPVNEDPGLLEMDLGEWEGLSREEVSRVYPGGFEERGRKIVDYRPPGGESFRDLFKRVRPVAEEFLNGGKRTLAVTHAGVIRVLCCFADGADMAKLFDYTPGQGTLSILRRETGRMYLEANGILPGCFNLNQD